MAILSALAHAPALAWLLSAVLLSVSAQVSPATPPLAIGVLLIGAASAWVTTLIGARRARVPYGLADMLAAPAYWSMLTLAFMHAAWRLVVEPHAWDKTPHVPDAPAVIEGGDTRATGRRAA
jgi:hypothetical protein